MYSLGCQSSFAFKIYFLLQILRRLSLPSSVGFRKQNKLQICIDFHPSNFRIREMVEAKASLCSHHLCLHVFLSLPRSSFFCLCNELQGLALGPVILQLDRKHQQLRVIAAHFSQSNMMLLFSQSFAQLSIFVEEILKKNVPLQKLSVIATVEKAKGSCLSSLRKPRASILTFYSTAYSPL